MRTILGSMACAIGLFAFTLPAQAQSPAGIWLTKDQDARVRIAVSARAGCSRRQHVYHVPGPDQVEQGGVRKVQRHDAGFLPDRGIGQPWTEEAEIGKDLAAPRRAGHRGVEYALQPSLRTLGHVR